MSSSIGAEFKLAQNFYLGAFLNQDSNEYTDEEDSDYDSTYTYNHLSISARYITDQFEILAGLSLDQGVDKENDEITDDERGNAFTLGFTYFL